MNTVYSPGATVVVPKRSGTSVSKRVKIARENGLLEKDGLTVTVHGLWKLEEWQLLPEDVAIQLRLDDKNTPF